MTTENGPVTAAPVLLIITNSTVAPPDAHGSDVRLTFRSSPVRAYKTGLKAPRRSTVISSFFVLKIQFKIIIVTISLT